jgi:hypothetical protein
MAIQFGLAAGLMVVALPFVIKIMVGLGMGFVVFQGATSLISLADASIMANFNSMPADMLAVAQMAGFADGLALILSAYAAQVAIMVTTGALTRFKVTPT